MGLVTHDATLLEFHRFFNWKDAEVVVNIGRYLR